MNDTVELINSKKGFYMKNHNRQLIFILILSGILVCLIICLYQKVKNNTEKIISRRPDAEDMAEVSLPSSDDVKAESSVLESPEPTESCDEGDEPTAPEPEMLPGEGRNSAAIETRETYQEGFYAETLSDELLQYMSGRSIPLDEQGNPSTPHFDVNDLRYLHILHYDIDGTEHAGELICNKAIATELLDLFYELYQATYPIESVKLIEEYEGDDTLSMTANNTSCFNYRTVQGSTNLSKHSYGLAIDINPFYNPYYKKYKDGRELLQPDGSRPYLDRTRTLP